MATSSRTQEEPRFPQDIVQEILLRIPLKTLITCLSVCRSWHSLIKSSRFITSKKDCDTKLLFLIERNKGSYSLLSHNGPAAFTKVENTKIPFQVDSPYCSITSLNGLFCVDLRVTASCRHIFLWNPSVRRFKFIDTMSVCFDSTTTGCPELLMYYHLANYGLGLDEFSNEYKIVKIYGMPTKVDVYSLTTNSWHTRVVDDHFGNKAIIPHARGHAPKHAHVNGAIHWLAYFRERKEMHFRSDLAILSFDFSKEVLGDLSLPTKWDDKIKGVFQEDLKVLKGMLSFLVSCQSFAVERSVCYVWLMKEYGVAASWTKAYTIVPGTSFYYPLGFLLSSGKLVYYSSDGTRLMSYDLDNEKYTSIGFEVSFITQMFFDFKESLILLDQGSASMEQALQEYQRTI